VIEAPAARRIALFAALSGAVHAIAVSTGRLELPQAPGELPPIALRMVYAAPPAPSAAASVSAPPARRIRPQPAAALATAAPPPADVPSRVEPDEDAASDAEEPEIAEAPAPDRSPERVAEPVDIATAPVPPPTEEAPALPAFPRKGRITYELVYGRDQFPVGRTVQTWQTDGRRYQLASRSETTGIIDLLRSQHRTYLSRGEITPQGLRPQTFLMSRNRGRGAEEARAKFDWANGSVVLGPAAGQRTQDLPPRSQDLVSFMYQLALDPPPPGRMELPVTNGTRLEIYELEVLPEEQIETPLGTLRALPIRQVRARGAEGADLWLAVEYRYLPVRIRFYGRDGQPAGEQIVSEIRLGD
jgi:hypothetical protein